MPAVKDVGEPCAGEPHARIDGGREETSTSRLPLCGCGRLSPTRPTSGREDMPQWRDWTTLLSSHARPDVAAPSGRHDKETDHDRGRPGSEITSQPAEHEAQTDTEAKKVAAFFKISRSSRKRAFSRRSRRSSSRSSLVSPSRLPSSISLWRTQRRNDSGATTNSSATARYGRSLTRYSLTASCRNSGEKRLPCATSTPFRTLARPSSGWQRDRVNSSQDLAKGCSSA